MGKSFPHVPVSPYGTPQKPVPWTVGDIAFVASFVGLLSASVGGIFWWQYESNAEDKRLVAASTAAAKYAPGDIVLSRVGNFRGIITGRTCREWCQYRVRFNVASMEPYWLEEVEIERWHPQ